MELQTETCVFHIKIFQQYRLIVGKTMTVGSSVIRREFVDTKPQKQTEKSINLENF